MNQISPDPEAPIRVLLIDDDRDDYNDDDCHYDDK